MSHRERNRDLVRREGEAGCVGMLMFFVGLFAMFGAARGWW